MGKGQSVVATHGTQGSMSYCNTWVIGVKGIVYLQLTEICVKVILYLQHMEHRGQGHTVLATHGTQGSRSYCTCSIWNTGVKVILYLQHMGQGHTVFATHGTQGSRSYCICNTWITGVKVLCICNTWNTGVKVILYLQHMEHRGQGHTVFATHET